MVGLRLGLGLRLRLGLVVRLMLFGPRSRDRLRCAPSIGLWTGSAIECGLQDATQNIGNSARTLGEPLAQTIR